MQPQDVAISATKRFLADVAAPQMASDARRGCQFPAQSGKVRAGRTQAACLMKRRLCGKPFPTFQKDWSRGCRRAHALFSHFAWLPLWQHVQRKRKKLYLLMNRFPLSRLTPANTSSLRRRVGRGTPVWHADFYGVSQTRALVPVPLLRYIAATPFLQDGSLC